MTSSQPIDGGAMPGRPARSPRARVAALGANYGVVGVLVILVILAAILYPGFLAPANLSNVLAQNAAVGVIAVGMTYVIISGSFDLSVGATYALSSTLFAGWTLQTGSVALAAVGTLLVGALIGVVNGLIVARLGINSFIATLGTSSIILGISYIFSNSTTIRVYQSVPQFQDLALSTVAGIRLPIVILALTVVVGAVVMSFTSYGRNISAAGANREAAWLSGLRVRGLSVSVFVIAGVLASLAGMMDASRLGVGQSDVGGSMALDAIAIVVVGGTSILGGEGAIWRSAIGLLILATLTNLFYSLNVTQNWQLVTKGAIVLIAVTVDGVIRFRGSRS